MFFVDFNQNKACFCTRGSGSVLKIWIRIQQLRAYGSIPDPDPKPCSHFVRRSGARDGGGADQPGGVAVVPPGGGRPALQHRGHLLADGDGRPPAHPAPRRRPHQARLRLPPLLRRGARHSGRGMDFFGLKTVVRIRNIRNFGSGSGSGSC